MLLLASLATAQADARPEPAEVRSLVREVDVTFPSEPNGSFIDRDTYLYYIRTRAGQPFDQRLIAEDVKRLWDTAFLEDISVDVSDAPSENGVVGKRVVFRLEERRRIRIVEYVGSKVIDRKDIDRKLADLNAQIAVDSLADAARIKRVEDILRDLLRERGHPYASVTHRLTDVPDTAFTRLTFTLDEGPREKTRRVTFTGVSAANERAVRRRMKAAKDEDLERVLAYYHDNGYVTASIGAPVVRATDVQIPVTEGKRYRIRGVAFDGNRAATTEALRPYFGLEQGGYYNDSKVRRGFEKAREWYGVRGYYEFTGYSDVHPDADGNSAVDVTIRVSEGDQYFIHRIAMNGNTTTQDNVIRRQLGLVEGEVFNTEALKTSVKRLNQLELFQPIAERDVKVEPVPGGGRLLDVTFDVKEQRHDKVNVGGGLSQAEGLFGNISYVTPNLLGRGETFSLVAEQGSRGSLYQATLAEPYLLGKALSGSISVFGGRTAYDTTTIANAYSESRKGATLSFGKPLSPFTRIMFGYTYEIDDVGIADSLLGSAFSSAGAPALAPSDLGRHADGRVMLGIVHNTVDSLFMPHDGVRLSAGVQIAGSALGGDFNYVKPEAEAVWYRSTSRWTGIGLRAQAGVLNPYGSTADVPYYLRYSLGGENQIRGVGLRTVGPLDVNERVLGGTTFTLFNAEYHVDVSRRIRVLAFGDAGQAFDAAHPFDVGDLRTSTGIELRVVLPFVHLPLRFIYYWNPSRDSFQPEHGFRVAIGTTF